MPHLIYPPPAESTKSNSLAWRIWHCVNYLIGGTTFLFGSIILFPVFMSHMDTATISAWAYTIGSFCFLLADLTEWSHYESSLCCFKPCCLHTQLSINFFISVIGSTLYLIGSIFFIPKVNQSTNGELMFIIGSAVIVVAQLAKICFHKSEPWHGWKHKIFQDLLGFLVDLFAGLGAMGYFFGTFLLQKSETDPNYLIAAVLLYSEGGAFFSLSGVFMWCRYFCQDLFKRDNIIVQDQRFGE